MTEHVENHGGQPAKKDCGCGCNGSGNCGGKGVSATRRRLLGGVPVALTFVSSRALATSAGGIVCTPSIVASATNSHSGLTQGQNCAVSPGCWKNLAASDGLWQSTGTSQNGNGGQTWTLSTSFSQTFGLPTHFQTSTDGNWSVSGTDSLTGALHGQMHVQWKGAGNALTAGGQNGVGFVANIVAALLNASAFGPNHYPAPFATGVEVIAAVKSMWVALAKASTQSNVDAATTGSSTFASLVSGQNQSLDQCFQGL
jgi:hypothetical protein